MDSKAKATRKANVCAQHPGKRETKLLKACRAFARCLVPFICEELRDRSREEWLDQACSPLGRRRHCELARSGAFPARKVGRRWLARRADVDAFIQAQHTGAPPETRPANDHAADDDERNVRAVLAEVNLEALRPQTSDENWRVFVSHEIEGVPVAVIAELEGAAVSTVYNRLRLARRDLKAAILRLRARVAFASTAKLRRGRR